ncbi:MAG: DUF2490 domain-containing protein [Gammaproteobacteria bacterium]|nr:DUF2490 domain-containing protein [Gammaproteobacteria bacterium]
MTQLIFIVALMITALSGTLDAKSNEDFSFWGAVQGQGSWSTQEPMSQWQWWMEAQGRFANDVSRLGQSLVRPGMGYALNQQVSVWLGYAWVMTDPKGRDETNEHRIWQQLIWKKQTLLGNVMTRTRLEQRLLDNGNDTGWRFRQFIKYTHPVYSDHIYLSVWDEVFVNINSTDWGAHSGFGQNRIFAGFGFFLDQQQHFRFELGYINQFVENRRRNDLLNHIVSASLFIRY